MRNRLKKEYYLNFKKLNKVNISCRKITEKLINSVVTPMNEIHNLKHNKNFWYIILSPWINSFTQNSLHHYMLSKNKKKVVLPKKINFKVAKNCHAYWLMVHYNHITNFSDMYKQYFSKKSYFKKIDNFNFEIINMKKFSKISILKILIKNILKIYNLIALSISNFYIDKLNPKLILKLAFKFKSLPVIIMQDFEDDYKNKQVDVELRRKFYELTVKNLDKKIPKEIVKLMCFQIPISYIENFKEHYSTYKQSNFSNTKFFLLGSFINENIKFLISKYKINGNNLFYYQHGGTYGCMKYHDYENYEKNISNYYFSWFKEKNKKTIQTPSYFFIKNKIKRKKKYKLVLINQDFPFFYRYYITLIKEQLNDSIKQQINFIKNLSKNVKEQLYLRQPPSSLDTQTENQYQRAGINFPKIENENYKSFIGKSEIIITSYFSTTLFQALMNDIPVILLIEKNKYIFNYNFKKYLVKMKKTKILHYSAKSASKHINAIYTKPETWWYNKKTIKCKNELLKNFGFTSKNWENYWVKNISKNLN